MGQHQQQGQNVFGLMNLNRFLFEILCFLIHPFLTVLANAMRCDCSQIVLANAALQRKCTNSQHKRIINQIPNKNPYTNSQTYTQIANKNPTRNKRHLVQGGRGPGPDPSIRSNACLDHPK